MISNFLKIGIVANKKSLTNHWRWWRFTPRLSSIYAV